MAEKEDNVEFPIFCPPSAILALHLGNVCPPNFCFIYLTWRLFEYILWNKRIQVITLKKFIII